MPIGTAPMPGTLYVPGAGCQNGFLTAGDLVTGSCTLIISPNLYFAQRSCCNAYGAASCLNTTTTLQSFSGVPVAPFVIRKTFGQANGKISFGPVASKTIRCLPLI